MEYLSIAGGKPLFGELNISAAKNAVLPMLSACMLTREDVVLENIPRISDVVAFLSILNDLGVKHEWSGNTLTLNAGGAVKNTVNERQAGALRASFLLSGALIARVGDASIARPGGCKIGARPVDMHISGFEAMGLCVKADEQRIKVSGKPHGADICLPYPSVGATENLLLCAVCASGDTTLRNAALEPEVEDFAKMLCRMGARISGMGTRVINIHGVPSLHGARYRPIPDRIEAGSYAFFAAACGGDVTLLNIDRAHLQCVMETLLRMGVDVNGAGEWLRIRSEGRLHGAKVCCSPYPGFPTDLQAPLTALCACAKGESVIEETVFENRFNHVQQLNHMGARIRVQGRLLRVNGQQAFHGGAVRAHDLRCGAALVLAGLKAGGNTEITGLEHIDRGYENLHQKLRELGAQVHREQRLPNVGNAPIGNVALHPIQSGIFA